MILFLNDFRLLRPSCEYSQTSILAWLAAAHGKAESLKKEPDFNRENFEQKVHSLLTRVGSPEKVMIQTRGTQLQDVGHTRWEEMELFSLTESSSCIGEKTAFYGKA